MNIKIFFLGVISLALIGNEVQGAPSSLENLRKFPKNITVPRKRLKNQSKNFDGISRLNISQEELTDEGIMILPSDETMGEPMIPEIVPLPLPEDKVEDSNGNVWVLEKTHNFEMEGRVNVVVPLEIITDLDIKALVIDDQKLEIPFEIEMNKTPEKQNYYILNYSETEIDIDGDGTVDTRILSPKYINGKIVDDNLLVIDGKNITREGVHSRKVYITIELMDREEI